MAEQLALAWRPRTFDDLVGQPAVQVFLQRMVAIDQVPAAVLFEGSRGTGKTTTVRILGAALNCHETNRPCGTCPSCKSVFDGSSLDFIEIDAASNGLVDDIRQLRQQVYYRHSGDYRIVAFDEAHSISPAGFNALLKTLEQPPPRTLFALLTTESHKIPETVASRCMPFTFRRLSIDDITRRLAHIAAAEGFKTQPDLLRLIAERADGAMRDAIVGLDQVARVGMTTAEQYRRLFGYTDHSPAILTALINGDLPAAFTHLDQALTRVADPRTITADTISVLRDVLVLRCGGEIPKSGTALEARQNLALALETPTVLAALKILWQLKTQVHVDDPRSNLELAVVMLSEVFHTLPSRPVTSRVSLTEMGFS